MDICVFGAGAVGGHLAARLAAAECRVSVVARGPHLEAIRQNGLELRIADRTIRARVRATHDPREIGPQDLIVVSVKAPALAGIVDDLKPMLKSDTSVVYAMNGIPWWYFHGMPDRPDRKLAILDPGGRLWDEIGVARTIGCVVYSANEVVEPGVILNRSPARNRLILGEPAGRTGRAAAIAQALAASGMDIQTSADIRKEIWRKFLVGNMTLSLLAALTGSAADAIVRDPELARVAREIAREGKTLAARLGVDLSDLDPDVQLDPANVPAGNRPSMLQDLERGRPMEIDAMVTIVQDLAAETSIPVPNFAIVAALLKRRARAAGCYFPVEGRASGL
ncbi:MAG: 2-dehydropantoate 2-reductase [Tagaea sp.]|nr:2-dehydropantoate 2-reductase [Tagaea sp.]